MYIYIHTYIHIHRITFIFYIIYILFKKEVFHRARYRERPVHSYSRKQPGGRCLLRYSVYLLYWYKSTNTDAEGAAGFSLLTSVQFAQKEKDDKEKARAADTIFKYIYIYIIYIYIIYIIYVYNEGALG
jgi:hypothetical protein